MAGSGARSNDPAPGGAGQGELFGDVPAASPPPRARAADAPVGACVPPPGLAALAARLSPGLRFGTSSWGFPGWAGLVYDRACREAQLSRHGLAAYAGHPLLRAVGVDRGFYAPVPEIDLQRYAASVPEDFRFLLKAHAALTTVPGPSPPPFLAGTPPAFLDAAQACRAVVEPAARALGGRLGALLFQFSPLGPKVLRHRARLLERLHGFLLALPRGLPYAVEFRDPEMLGPDYEALLEDAGAVHGACAHPRMPPVPAQFGAAMPGARGPLVIRWLLHPGQRYEAARRAYAPFDRLVAPDPRARDEIATTASQALAAGREVLVIVNNKAEGCAPLGIVALARHMAGGVDAA